MRLYRQNQKNQQGDVMSIIICALVLAWLLFGGDDE